MYHKQARRHPVVTEGEKVGESEEEWGGVIRGCSRMRGAVTTDHQLIRFSMLITIIILHEKTDGDVR